MTDDILLLLADDEPLILLASEDALTAGGFTVVKARDGNEAMVALEANRANLAGIITDIRLGAGPTGWDLARHARELSPDLPVVYATGDSGHEWPIYGVPRSVVIQKPYAEAQLVAAISALLTELQTRGAG